MRQLPLLALILTLPLLAAGQQDTLYCDNLEGLEFDHDGDMVVGNSDVLQLLQWYGCNYSSELEDALNCDSMEGLEFDFNGDLVVGINEVLQLLQWYDNNYDIDQDGILDCNDDCVGQYDECGVCNGQGPQVLTIDTIIVSYDSTYIDSVDAWLVYELDMDTSFFFQCEEANEFVSCGDDILLDSYSYITIQIGDQCWFAENLRTLTYSNGDSIPQGLTSAEWASITVGATTIYGEGSSSCVSYSPDFDACDEMQSSAELGRLYNWYAVDDARGLCPTGWHVPTDDEWTILKDFLTPQVFAYNEATALKSTTGWYNNGNGTDAYSFSAVPGGYRSQSNGAFQSSGLFGCWWTSSPNGSSSTFSQAWYRDMTNSDTFIMRLYDHYRAGFSVRCILNDE